MRFGILLPLILLVAPARGAELGPLEVVGDDDDGNSVVFRVTVAQALQTPVWKEGDAAPPFSPRRAEKVAREIFDKLIKQQEHWRCDRIALEDLGDGSHWVYVVTFSPHVSVVGRLPELHVVVLMNGKAGDYSVAKRRLEFGNRSPATKRK